MKLYKYMSLSTAIHVLKNKSIRFTPPSIFNDPFEVLPNISIPNSITTKKEETKTRELYKRIANLLPTTGDISAQRTKELLDHFNNITENTQIDPFYILGEETRIFNILHTLRNYFGVLCLSESRDSVLMWSHYADNHCGVVLEIDVAESLPKECLDEKCFKVKYKQLPPNKTWANFSIEDLFINKGYSWKYEKEQRLIIPLHKLSNYEANQNSFDNGVNNSILTKTLLSEQIISVTVGCNYRNNSPLVQKEFKDLVKSNEYRHIKIEAAYRIEGKYELRFQDETRFFL